LIYQVKNSSRARIVPTDSQRGGWGGHHVNGTAHPGPDALPQQLREEAKPESARRTANSECSECTLQQASVSARPCRRRRQRRRRWQGGGGGAGGRVGAVFERGGAALLLPRARPDDAVGAAGTVRGFIAP